MGEGLRGIFEGHSFLKPEPIAFQDCCKDYDKQTIRLMNSDDCGFPFKKVAIIVSVTKDAKSKETCRHFITELPITMVGICRKCRLLK